MECHEMSHDMKNFEKVSSATEKSFQPIPAINNKFFDSEKNI